MRFKVLETIELRSLGWRRTAEMSQYYEQNITKMTGRGFRPKSRMTNIDPEPESSNLEASKEGEKASSMSGLSVTVDGEKLFVQSKSTAALKAAKKAIVGHYCQDRAWSEVYRGIKYTKEQIMALSGSRLCHLLPPNWGNIMASLPKHVCKPYSSGLVSVTFSLRIY